MVWSIDTPCWLVQAWVCTLNDGIPKEYAWQRSAVNFMLRVWPSPRKSQVAKDPELQVFGRFPKQLAIRWLLIKLMRKQSVFQIYSSRKWVSPKRYWERALMQESKTSLNNILMLSFRNPLCSGVWGGKVKWEIPCVEWKARRAINSPTLSEQRLCIFLPKFVLTRDLTVMKVSLTWDFFFKG